MSEMIYIGLAMSKDSQQIVSVNRFTYAANSLKCK